MTIGRSSRRKPPSCSAARSRSAVRCISSSCPRPSLDSTTSRWPTRTGALTSRSSRPARSRPGSISALRDIERNTTYVLDGGVTGLGGKPVYDGTILVRVANASTDEPADDDTDVASGEPPAGEQPAATEEPSPDLPAAKDKTSLFEL